MVIKIIPAPANRPHDGPSLDLIELAKGDKVVSLRDPTRVLTVERVTTTQIVMTSKRRFWRTGVNAGSPLGGSWRDRLVPTLHPDVTRSVARGAVEGAFAAMDALYRHVRNGCRTPEDCATALRDARDRADEILARLDEMGVKPREH